MTKLLKANTQTPKMLTSAIALALISIFNLSQDNYQTIRKVAKAHHTDIFPSDFYDDNQEINFFSEKNFFLIFLI